MGRRYSSVCSAAVASAKSHQTAYQPASPLGRPRIYDILISSSATPADVALQFTVPRTTAAPGTPVAITPSPLDNADPATGILASKQAATEPTGSNGTGLLVMSVNQRVTWRWIANPGSELVIPATANYGMSLYCAAISSGTPSMDTCLLWEE